MISRVFVSFVLYFDVCVFVEIVHKFVETFVFCPLLVLWQG